MSSDDDEDALTWAGGRDPSHYETPAAKPVPPAKPAKKNSATAPADSDARSDAAADVPDEDELPAPMSSVVLVSLGILGGIYLLYTVGWVVSWQRFVYGAADVLGLVVFQIQQVLAILAPPLWFVTTILLTRNRRPAARLLWLLIGALVLIPWSFTFGR
ncbi:MAG TPA: hypothetical protein VGF80_03315 [Galbitalea sp.]